ncbi:MAG: sulfur carrier protein ThiS [Verrucomicrobia bacterium]|nr:sulfur carrier protein ThiS [Verrucomicrobiota bacterium]
MQLKLNGEPRELQAATVGQLISSHKLNPEAIVIELNGAILQKQAWAATALNEGDQVEIVSFVGGG